MVPQSIMSPFKLLTLPEEAFQNVLLIMKYTEIAALSKCSKSTKQRLIEMDFFPLSKQQRKVLLNYVRSRIATHAFPLFKLPAKALRNVLVNWNYMELIYFSLSTKQTNKAVKDLKLKARAAQIVIFDHVRIEIIFQNKTAIYFTFYDATTDHWNQGTPRIHLENMKPSHAAIKYGDYVDGEIQEERVVEKVWRKAEYTYKDWTEHLGNLVRVGEITTFDFEVGSERYDTHSILTALKAYHTYEFSVASECENGCHQEIHKAIPRIEHFVMNRVPYPPDHADYQRFICQNFRDFNFQPDSNVKLDEILLMNSYSFVIRYSTTITAKDVNRWLKLWIRGANRRLVYAYFQLDFERVMNRDTVLKGVRHQVVPAEREEVFDNADRTCALKGGFEIWSKLGARRANIQIYDRTRAVQFCVLP